MMKLSTFPRRLSTCLAALPLACGGGSQLDFGRAAPEDVVETHTVEQDERLLPFHGQFVGTFDPGMSIFPIQRKNEITGVPDFLRNARVLHDFVDRDQFFYQAYRTGDISGSLYSRISEGIDSTTLLGEWTDDVLVSVVVGENAIGKRLVLVDRDGDGDFAGERELEFAPDTLRRGETEIPIESALTTIDFGFVENAQLLRGSVEARFFYEVDTSPEQLSWDVPSYRRGEWIVRGEPYSVALGTAPVLRPGKYTFLYIDVDRDGRFDTAPDGLEAYSTDEAFNLAGYSWKVADLAADGSRLRLRRVDVAIPPRTALREGEEALGFTVESLSGDTVSLDDFGGEHVLLNFGWTGCAFSLAELPFLRQAHEQFEDRGFRILSLVEAQNEASLQEYVAQHSLPWPHAYENRTDDVARLYRVMGTPTNYLIGPDGVILATGEALRGAKLIATLEKLLGRADPVS